MAFLTRHHHPTRELRTLPCCCKQENNAVALVEVEKCRVKRVFPLGYKVRTQAFGGELLNP